MSRSRVRNRRTLVSMLVVPMLWIPPLQADEYRPAQRVDACDMAVDTLICRPAGLVATLIGTTLWAVSLPFSLAGGNERETRDKLVYEPAAYTFKRPLGSPECSCGGDLDP